MSGQPKRRRSRGLVSTLALVAWILVAAAIAHPTPGAAVVVVFVAGLITGGALVYHSATDPRPRRAPERPAARRPASPPPGAAATARPAGRRQASAPRGPGPDLHAVPDEAALRADLAARAARVSTHIPKPPDAGEPKP